ncbi:hypothetical protein SAY87_009534 [Trapa incisa]|uniref:Uncharacterized protein n=1 Tax=Trapa incisa TaxID=236973 RepID=A0AAN7PX67_9MYRT|nr:hypothetical protein SAY87_009534 [Trapa incisa]
MENGNKQPLLPLGEDDPSSSHQHEPHDSSTNDFFTPRIEDIGLINWLQDFCREFSVKDKKLGYLVSPSIFTSVYQYSVDTITQLFIGHISTLPSPLSTSRIQSSLASPSVHTTIVIGCMHSIVQPICAKDAKKGGAGPPHHLQLAPNAEAPMGLGRGDRDPQHLLGGYPSCSARLHLQRHMRLGLAGVLMESLPQHLELCVPVPHLCRHALISDPLS